jgi:hypothetical protein
VTRNRRQGPLRDASLPVFEGYFFGKGGGVGKTFPFLSRPREWHNSAGFPAEPPMVSKCANPACYAQLHYLHEGRIFRFDVAGGARREYFWLCHRCSADMTLTLRDGEVVLSPLYLATPESRVAS